MEGVEAAGFAVGVTGGNLVSQQSRKLIKSLRELYVVGAATSTVAAI
jgi:hypothetical protein